MGKPIGNIQDEMAIRRGDACPGYSPLQQLELTTEQPGFTGFQQIKNRVSADEFRSRMSSNSPPFWL